MDGLASTTVPGLYADTETDNVFLFDPVEYLKIKGMNTDEATQAMAYDMVRDSMKKAGGVVILIGDIPKQTNEEIV